MNAKIMTDSDRPQTNRLAKETSPYLLQHASNPVDWYPWGDEAFETARQENRPIFLSVGYSACHWCHVMEHESFEDEDIARLLNENFISIKVDREERPDVDQIYMTAVQLITRRGGWPMSVFMTPDGKPFYGGTYWPPTSRMGMPGFRDIILKLSDYWKNKRDEVDTSADQLVEAIQEMSSPIFQSTTLEKETSRKAIDSLLQTADRKHGGFGGAPKFPHSMDLRLLLRGYQKFGNEECLSVVKTALDKMLNGGIYDQLGGGFHRYSTDAYWLVPHFEKMLYDNALLVPAYTEAWQVTKNEEYKRAVQETLQYVEREMTSVEGGFFSTQDADSEGEEGKFFVWTVQEIQEVIGEENAKVFNAVYDVSKGGNWEGKNILNRPRSTSVVAEELEINEGELFESLQKSREKLFQHRSKRIAPGRDEKILASWNGMMIAAMAQAGFVFSNEHWIALARQAAEFVLAKMRTDNGELLHSYKDDRARFQAYLDDYACTIEGLVELFQADGDEQHLVEAISLAEIMIERFLDEEHGGFFFTADNHEKLIARTKEIQDNAVPSGNGMAATALIKLGRLCDRQDFAQVAKETLEAFGEYLETRPAAAGQALIALDLLLGKSQEVVVVADSEKTANEDLINLIRTKFLPNAVTVLPQKKTPTLTHGLTAGKSPVENGTRIYLCEAGACQQPAENEMELRQQLQEIR